MIGLDTAEHRIAVSNRIAEAAEMPWLEYLAGNVCDEVGKLTGSALWMHRSFHHIPERSDFDVSARQYFRQVRTSIGAGGVMVFMTSNAASRSLLPWVSQGQHTVPHLTRLIEQSGFEVRDVSYKGYLSVLPVRLRPRRSTDIDRLLAGVPGVRRLGGSFAVAAYPV